MKSILHAISSAMLDLTSVFRVGTSCIPFSSETAGLLARKVKPSPVSRVLSFSLKSWRSRFKNRNVTMATMPKEKKRTLLEIQK